VVGSPTVCFGQRSGSTLLYFSLSFIPLSITWSQASLQSCFELYVLLAQHTSCRWVGKFPEGFSRGAPKKRVFDFVSLIYLVRNHGGK